MLRPPLGISESWDKKNMECNRFLFSLCNCTSIILLLQDFQQENTEHMQPELVSLLRSSKQSFFHHLVASSPEALFRWGVLRATIRILAVFKSLGRKRAEMSRWPRQLNRLAAYLLAAYWVLHNCLSALVLWFDSNIIIIKKCSYWLKIMLMNVVFSPQLLPEKTPATTLEIWNSVAGVSADYQGNLSYN